MLATPTGTPHQTPTGPHAHADDGGLISIVVAEVGQSMATALKAAAMVQAGPVSTMPWASKGMDSKHMYNNYAIAMIKGFSGATLLSGLQPNWTLFQDAKNVETYHHNIKKCMHGLLHTMSPLKKDFL